MKKLRMSPGFKFQPSDEELILYLRMKTQGISRIPKWDCVVVEKNLYAQDNAVPWALFTDDYPWQITTKTDGDAGKIKVEKYLYVLTKLMKIGDRKTVRRVGSYTWDAATGPKEVWNSKGDVIGFKKMLNFRSKDMKIQGNWIMHEYCLGGISLEKLGSNYSSEYVICRIRCDYSTNIGESDGFGNSWKRRASSDQEIPVGKWVRSRGTDSNVAISETEVLESEENCGEHDPCGIRSEEKPRFDRESLMRKRIFEVGSSSIVVHEGDLIQDRGAHCTECYELSTMKRSSLDQEKSVGTEVCSSSRTISDIAADVVDSDCSRGEIGNFGGESDGFGKSWKRRASSDQEIPAGKRVHSRGTNGNVVISENGVQESEANYEKHDHCEILIEEKSRFDRESLMGKRVSEGGSSNIVVIEGDMVQDREAHCTECYELSAMKRSSLDQEKSVGTEVCSSSLGISSTMADITDSDCSSGGIGNNCEESQKG